jgi:hypothetical protein
MSDVVVRGNSAKFGGLESARGSVVFNEVTFLQEHRCGVSDVGTLLFKMWIIIQVVNTDAVQNRIT